MATELVVKRHSVQLYSGQGGDAANLDYVSLFLAEIDRNRVRAALLRTRRNEMFAAELREVRIAKPDISDINTLAH